MDRLPAPRVRLDPPLDQLAAACTVSPFSVRAAVCVGCVPEGMLAVSYCPGVTPVDQLDPRFAFAVPVVSQVIAPKVQLVLLPVASMELVAATLAVVAGLSETCT